MTLTEYNEMTPHELMLVIDAYNDGLQYETEQMLTQAWLTANWHRAKKMPKLDTMIKKMRPEKPVKTQTPEQMLAIVKAKHAAMSGETIKRGGGSDGRRT